MNCHRTRQESPSGIGELTQLQHRGEREEEAIVQGDEGPVHGVAQIVDCHGVTVGHEEKEEEAEERQEEVEGERCACPWMR